MQSAGACAWAAIMDHVSSDGTRCPLQAMDHLKAHTMSYGVGSAYDSYFARLTGKWAVYVAPEGSEKANSLDALMATAVLLAPILLVGAKIGGRLLAK